MFNVDLQAVKLKFFGTRPNWVVSYIAYTKFHSPRLVFHSPGQIFTRIGERASASFPAWSDNNVMKYGIVVEGLPTPEIWTLENLEGLPAVAAYPEN